MVLVLMVIVMVVVVMVVVVVEEVVLVVATIAIAVVISSILPGRKKIRFEKIIKKFIMTEVSKQKHSPEPLSLRI